MRINRWLLIALLVVAVLVGAGGMLASGAVNHYTSTESFCATSCHSMVIQSGDQYYMHSRHRSNNVGVLPSCGDCHIPKTNWFVETYTHVTSGIRDVIAETTHDFSKPGAWAAHRVDLEPEVLATMRAQDSVTCRSCHDASAIHPTSEAGQQSHAALQQGGVTCVDCHVNLVHPAATPAGAPATTPSSQSQ